MLQGGANKAAKDPGRTVLAQDKPTTTTATTATSAAAKHVLPAATPNEDPLVTNGRTALQATEGDSNRQLLVIRQLLERVEYSQHPVAWQLLRLLQPFGHDYPALEAAIATRMEILRRTPDLSGTGIRILLDEKQEAAAVAFNAVVPGNCAAFNTATGVDTSNPQLVARWQQTHKLIVDGKVDNATVRVATTPPPPPASTWPGAVSPTGTKTIPGGPEVAGSMGVRDPDLAAKRQARRKRDYASDILDHNFRDEEWIEVSDLDVFRAISRVDPSLPVLFRRMMTGQAHGEQAGKKPNLNFMGFELGSNGEAAIPTKGLWARIARSDTVDVAKVEHDPAKFYDNAAYGHTILAQLDDPAKRPATGKINCLWYAPRQAYSTLDEAARAFCDNIVGKLRKLEKSPYPEHQKLATEALTDASAYIQMLELSSYPSTNRTPTTADKTLGKLPYNGSGYNKAGVPIYETVIGGRVRAALADGTMTP